MKERDVKIISPNTRIVVLVAHVIAANKSAEFIIVKFTIPSQHDIGVFLADHESFFGHLTPGYVTGSIGSEIGSRIMIPVSPDTALEIEPIGEIVF
ncbi:hypothetical protein DSECCO2_663990 [anaerobic digester metagenome]